jgi:hypothetical protein
VKPETPEAVKKWKKGSISIQKERFLAQLNELPADEKGYIRFDLTKNEKGGEVFYSFRLNDWKPPQSAEAVKVFNDVQEKPDYDDAAAIRAENIPF